MNGDFSVLLTECWNYLKIVSLNEQPVTIQDVIVNGRKECTADRTPLGLGPLVQVMAAQFINVSNTTLKKGDAYGAGVSCEPVDAMIVTDKGTWKGGTGDR